MKSITRWLVLFAVSVNVATAAMAEVTITTVSKEVGKEGGAYSVCFITLRPNFFAT